MHDTPEGQSILAAMFYSGWALVARLLYHKRLVRLGHRQFWSQELVWEFPTAFFSTAIGLGISEYLSLGYWGTAGVVSAVSWLGPRGMEVMISRYTMKGENSDARQDP